MLEAAKGNLIQLSKNVRSTGVIKTSSQPDVTILAVFSYHFLNPFYYGRSKRRNLYHFLWVQSESIFDKKIEYSSAFEQHPSEA